MALIKDKRSKAVKAHLGIGQSFTSMTTAYSDSNHTIMILHTPYPNPNH